MALGYLDDSKLYAIASAIRAKTGDSATMTVDDMPDEIGSISTGAQVEPLSVTANGTYAAPAGHAYTPVTVNVSGGGGASNFVTGEFTATAEKGAVQEIDIPYSGAGYPIAGIVYVKGGAYNSSDTSDWYSSTQRHAVGVWAMVKCVVGSTPDYSLNGALNTASTIAMYKNSTSNAGAMGAGAARAEVIYTASNDPTATASKCVVIKSRKKIKIMVANTSYGLLQGVTYSYLFCYSS